MPPPASAPAPRSQTTSRTSKGVMTNTSCRPRGWPGQHSANWREYILPPRVTGLRFSKGIHIIRIFFADLGGSRGGQARKREDARRPRLRLPPEPGRRGNTKTPTDPRGAQLAGEQRRYVGRTRSDHSTERFRCGAGGWHVHDGVRGHLALRARGSPSLWWSSPSSAVPNWSGRRPPSLVRGHAALGAAWACAPQGRPRHRRQRSTPLRPRLVAYAQRC